jgi:hypothetical protein
MKTKILNFSVSNFNESKRKICGWLKCSSIQILLISAVLSNFKTAYAQTQQWIQVGSDLTTANPDYEVIKFDEEGNAFFAYSDQSALTSLNVKKFEGTSWSSVGPVNITSGAIINEKDIAFDTLGVPHVAFVNGMNQLTVVKFNGTDWDTLGSANFANTDGLNHRIAFEVDRITNNPIVAYRDFTTTRLCVRQWDGATWDYYNNGQDISAGSVSLIDMVVDDSYSCFIGYADGANSDSLTILRTHSALSNWVQSSTIDPVISNGPISALTLATDGSYPVVMYINNVDSKVYTHRYQGAGIWYECPIEIGTADFYKDLAIIRHGSETYVGFADTDELYKPTTKKLDDLDYYDVVEGIDDPGFASSTPRNMTFGNDGDGNLFVGFGNLTVQVYKLTTVSQVDISENLSYKFDIYPNPATDVVFVSLNSDCAYQKVELFSVDGRWLSTIEMNGDFGMISVDHLAPGSYVIRVSNDQMQTTKQFILY